MDNPQSSGATIIATILRVRRSTRALTTLLLALSLLSLGFWGQSSARSFLTRLTASPLPPPAKPVASLQVGQPGSVLVFPFYSSVLPTASETALTLTNQSVQAIRVQLFFLNGATCSNTGTFITLAANGSMTLNASQYAPGTTGWLLAVAVNDAGLPIQANQLLGSATLSGGDYLGNYEAKTVQALSASPSTNLGDGTAVLNFNGSGYEQLPTQLSMQIQSPVDAPGQRVVTVGLSGNSATSVTGAAQVGLGDVTNNRTLASEQFTQMLSGSCQALATIMNNSPRTPTPITSFLPSGDTGILSFNIGAGFGLLLTPRTAPNSGIKYFTGANITTTTLTIPIIPANSPASPPISTAKLGSVLVFPYHTSDPAANPSVKDTTWNISNHGTQTVVLHIFYLDGASCNQSDIFLELGPGCYSTKASNDVPDETGWMLVIPVDNNGLPLNYNSLAGQAIVKDGDYQGVYDAVAIQAISATPATDNGGTATLNFDGIGYEKVPNQFTAQIQNPTTVPGQKIVIAGLQGDLTTGTITGAAQIGTGLVRNLDGNLIGSFTNFVSGSCWAMKTISATSPVTGITPAQSALSFNIGAGVGLFMTPVTGAGSGISPLPVTSLISSTLTIPVFSPPSGGGGGLFIGSITTQPQDQGTNEMGMVEFTATVAGSAMVQWQVSADGGITFKDLPGETNPTLKVANVTMADAGKLYRAIFIFDCNVAITRAAKLSVLPFMVSILDPFVCFDKDTLTVHAELGNPNNIVNPFTFTTVVAPELTPIPNACVSTVGTCTTSATGVTVTGVFQPFQRMSVDYKVRLRPGVPNGVMLCILSTGTLQFGGTATINECASVNCPVAPFLVTDQRAGSLLVFPYYVSQAAQHKDTRLTLSNIGDTSATLHVFFIDGKTCNQSDQFLCLTPNASFSFKTSEFDPETTGWLLALAVDAQGRPTQKNMIAGNAFVQDGDYVDNYAAATFWAHSNALSAINEDGTATLFFDGGSYDPFPTQLTTEIQSPLDAIGQRLVTVGLSGDLTTNQLTGAAQVGAGTIYNGNEKPFGSFNTLLTGNCQAIATISTSNPRVPFGLSQMIPAGQTGSLNLKVGAAVGLLMTPRTNRWGGIRGLHILSYNVGTLTIPMFRPTC